MSLRVLLLAVLAVLVGSIGRAEAAPMLSDLSTVRRDATTIVIGTMSDTSLSINVDTVLRGNVPLGWKPMKTSPTGDSHARGRVIAFLDKDDQFQWVGHLAGGTSIETGVLHLNGFFDWNAHLVSPGMMTLAQLKTYLASGTFTQRFAVRIMVEDGHGNFVPSGHAFAFDYDPFTHTTAGAPSFPCLDQPSVGALEWGTMRILFSDPCQRTGSKWRRLDLEGAPTGVNASGEITFDVSPDRPFLDAADLAAYLKDGNIVDVKRFLDVKLSDGTTWRWELGEGLIDPRGRPHKAGGMSSQSKTTNNVRVVTMAYEFDDRVLTLTNPKSNSMSTGGGAGLVVMAATRSYDACTFAEPGKPDRTCTITRGTSKLVR